MATKANSGKSPAKAAELPKVPLATVPAGETSAAGADALPEIQPTHLVVRSLTDGFRRAGRAWSTQEVTVPIDEFDAAQVAMLLAERNLVVVPAVLAEGAE